MKNMKTSIVILALIGCVASAGAQEGMRAPVGVAIDDISVKRIVLRPSLMKQQAASVPRAAMPEGSSSRGECPEEIWTHTDSDWGPGEYYLQAGMVQGETAATSYTLSADKFPLRLDRFEVLFATLDAVGQTTTHWTVRVFQGTPDTGTVVAEYSSDDVILPHLVMPPGTTGAILNFLVDPTDPDQIYIDDDGSQTFTVGVRIDQHNSPGIPCSVEPDLNNNAFLCTDISGLATPHENWGYLVDGVNCFCGAGWMTFQQLPFFCRPNGDWVIRATVTPLDCIPLTGACCRSNGTCTDEMTELDCATISGTYQGDQSQCSEVNCPLPTGACCVKSTSECLQVDHELCLLGGGIFYHEESCDSSFVCFPIGACCLLDGTCLASIDPDECDLHGGQFQGDSTECEVDTCPQPLGACCLSTGNCADLEESLCSGFGGTWLGMGTNCTDDNCDEEPCEGDIDGNNVVNVSDLLDVIAEWGCTGVCSADVNNDLIVNVQDLLIVIAAWGPCP